VLRNPLNSPATPRGTVWHLLLNYAPEFSCRDAPIFLERTPPSPRDREIASRLLDAFNAATAYERTKIPPESRPFDGIWNVNKYVFHSDLEKALATNNAADVADALRNCFREKAAFGLGHGERLFQVLSDSPDGREANVLIVNDRLLSLAVALGAIPQEVPEQGPYGANSKLPPEQIVAAAEAVIGADISRPRVMGAFGPLIGDRLFDARSAEDAYSAFRLCQILGNRETALVWEIGAGFGGVPLQAIRMGIGSYVTFDLPLISVVQGWFLAHALGPEMVSFFGEANARIAIRPYWEVHTWPNHPSIIFNRDSLPEIHEPRAREYLNKVEQLRCLFLSINQESRGVAVATRDVHQTWVPGLMDGRAGVKRLSRHPYWIRRGYVEELYGPA
jgi:hypothetical protein